jgi:hypothetical protein
MRLEKCGLWRNSGSLALSPRAPRLVTNLSVHLLIPAAISPPKMDGIEQFVR